jgi:hypothetical protein
MTPHNLKVLTLSCPEDKTMKQTIKILFFLGIDNIRRPASKQSGAFLWN